MTEPLTYTRARDLFLRALGFVYAIAFASLAVQLKGLIGSRGLLPAAPWLHAIHAMYGAKAFTAFPTIFWLNASDAALMGAAWLGVLLSLLLVANVAPRIVSALLWLLYLSLCTVGQDFLSFQWDTLLLEAGVLAVLYAPATLLPRDGRARAPLAVARWLVVALLIKLMFLSGLTKLLSGDPTWRNLTALDYHFMTQPLPPWTAWYAAQLPGWMHQAATLAMYGAELVLPWLALAPARWPWVRRGAALGMIGFQLSIMLTGNYGFFNLLAIVLCIPLFDDALLARLFRRPTPALAEERSLVRPITIGTAAVIGVLSACVSIEEIAYTVPRSEPPSLGVIGALASAARPLRSINGYGLFRVMTTERPEIVIEGSADGVRWEEYQFKWKPGDVNRRPAFVEPYHPRLDWQMWFAALNPAGARDWLEPLAAALLENRPEVLSLMARNPFPGSGPRYIRLAYYTYRFTTWEERRATGAWWHRGTPQYLTGPIAR